MNKYHLTGLTLEQANYKFTRPDTKRFGISMRDRFTVNEIDAGRAVLTAGREILLGQEAESSIYVEYSAVIESDSDITEQEIITAIKERKINLTTVFSKISLLIGNITGMSPFGVIVTPPDYIPDIKNKT